jgi:hypothetical protein
LARIVVVRRHRNGCQYADNRDHEHQLDQGESPTQGFQARTPIVHAHPACELNSTVQLNFAKTWTYKNNSPSKRGAVA